MDGQQLLSKVKRLAGKINDVASQITINDSLGFAIPLPTDVSDQTISETSEELKKLRWSFEIVSMKGKSHIVLFPFG